MSDHSQIGAYEVEDGAVIVVTPLEVDVKPVKKSLSAGGYHSMYSTPDGRVLCWGYGAGGELGRSTMLGPRMMRNMKDLKEASDPIPKGINPSPNDKSNPDPKPEPLSRFRSLSLHILLPSC